MANSKRGEVIVEIGGDSRVLVYDYNAICELEELCGGKSIAYIFGFGDEEQLKERVGFSVIRKAVFVGLKRKNKGLTIEKVGAWLADEQHRIGEVVTAVSRAILLASNGSDAQPKPVEGDGEAVDPTSATGG